MGIKIERKKEILTEGHKLPIGTTGYLRSNGEFNDYPIIKTKNALVILTTGGTLSLDYQVKKCNFELKEKS